MKFQNCILNKFCNAPTNGRTDKLKGNMPFNFSKVGGIIKVKVGMVFPKVNCLATVLLPVCSLMLLY